MEFCAMVLNAIVDKLKRSQRMTSKGRQFEGLLIIQTVS
ncbi:transposase [Roseibium sp. TrichSKD4]|nr:transposase [Roseibium sp. TrichSKD4]